MLKKDPRQRATIFDIFNDDWIDKSDDELESFAKMFYHKNCMMKNLNILPKEKSLPVNLKDSNFSPLPPNDNFNFSVKQVGQIKSLL